MKIVAFLRVYNEEDIIEEVVEHLISQGLEVVILDNGSTDTTYKKCQKLAEEGKIKLEQIYTKDFNEVVILRAAYDLAISCSPDWLVYSDADEFLESGIPNKNLKEVIQQVDSEGNNLIQFDRFDFFITDDDNESAKSFKEKMPYYSWQGDYLYRAWKYKPGIRVGESISHYPIFPESYPYKIHPTKFVLRHYTFRSPEQAKKKMKERLRGSEKAYGNYKKTLKTDFTKKVNHKILTKYNNYNNWNYEIKYCPYSWLNPPKKEDIFTYDGFLKTPEKTVFEYKHLLDEERSRLIPYRLRRVPQFIKNKLLKKI